MQAHKEHRNRRATFPHPTIVDTEPEELVVTLDADGEPAEAEADADAEPDAEVEHDTGELYGVHVAPAGDRAMSGPDDSYVDADLGESWIEALGQHSTESGPVPEHEVTVIDESDPHDGHPPTDFRDRPKADRGSGGPGGL